MHYIHNNGIRGGQMETRELFMDFLSGEETATEQVRKVFTLTPSVIEREVTVPTEYSPGQLTPPTTEAVTPGKVVPVPGADIETGTVTPEPDAGAEETVTPKPDAGAAEAATQRPAAGAETATQAPAAGAAAAETATQAPAQGPESITQQTVADVAAVTEAPTQPERFETGGMLFGPGYAGDYYQGLGHVHDKKERNRVDMNIPTA